MAVLSDKTLRAEIDKGRLVKGPRESAVHCSYEFLPGKIFPAEAPDDAFAIDWTSASATDVRYTIKPSEIVWIRTRAQVELPNNICGLWVQTNTLSRKGLLLINASLVEPGYTGYLSCNFVNFGKEPVVIQPSTQMAKLLFLKLDQNCEVPFTKKIENYDQMIGDLARVGSRTFLQVADIAAGIKEQRVEAQAALDQREADIISELSKRAKEEDEALTKKVKELRETEAKQFETDVKKSLQKAFGWGAAAIVVLGIAYAGVDKIKEKLRDDAVTMKQVDEAIGRALASRPAPSSTAKPLDAPPTDATVEALPGFPHI